VKTLNIKISDTAHDILSSIQFNNGIKNKNDTIELLLLTTDKNIIIKQNAR